MKLKTLTIAAIYLLVPLVAAAASDALGGRVYVWRPTAGEFGGKLLPATAFSTSGSTSSGSTGSTGSGTTPPATGSDDYVFRSPDFSDSDAASALKVSVSLSARDTVRYKVQEGLSYSCAISTMYNNVGGYVGNSDPNLSIIAVNAGGYFLFKPKVTGKMAISIWCAKNGDPMAPHYLDEMLLTVNP